MKFALSLSLGILNVLAGSCGDDKSREGGPSFPPIDSGIDGAVPVLGLNLCSQPAAPGTCGNTTCRGYCVPPCNDNQSACVPTSDPSNCECGRTCTYRNDKGIDSPGCRPISHPECETELPARCNVKDGYVQCACK